MGTIDESNLLLCAQVVDMICEEVSPSIRAKHLQVLCIVAMNPNLTIKEIDSLISAHSTVPSTFKLVHELSDKSWKKDPKDLKKRLPGFGLLSIRSNESDKRLVQVNLSEKGEQFFKRLKDKVKKQ